MAPQQRRPTTIKSLPSELLWEILIRVPAKPLAQMRSVSKPLNHLLSHPSFIKSHLHHHSLHNDNSDEVLLVLTDGSMNDPFLVTSHSSRSPHLQLTNFIKLPAAKGVKFLGYVNGLICFYFHTHYKYNPFGLVIQIWNPSLSTILTLPPCYIYFKRFDYTRIYFRFGYDPKTDDYKLVKLMSRPGLDFKKRLHVEVYSMRKGSWELVMNHGFPSHVIYISYNVDTVCVDGHNGHIHWLGRVIGNSCKLQTIVVFDLSVYTFSEISLPDFVVKYDDKPRLWNGIGALYGKLCVISCVEGYENEVWVMNEYGVTESWVKHHVLSNFGCGDGIDHPLEFTLNNEFLFARLKDRLVSYDPIASKVKSFNINPRHHLNIQVVRYVESLVWITPAKHVKVKHFW